MPDIVYGLLAIVGISIVSPYLLYILPAALLTYWCYAMPGSEMTMLGASILFIAFASPLLMSGILGVVLDEAIEVRTEGLFARYLPLAGLCVSFGFFYDQEILVLLTTELRSGNALYFSNVFIQLLGATVSWSAAIALGIVLLLTILDGIMAILSIHQVQSHWQTVRFLAMVLIVSLSLNTLTAAFTSTLRNLPVEFS